MREEEFSQKKKDRYALLPPNFIFFIFTFIFFILFIFLKLSYVREEEFSQKNKDRYVLLPLMYIAVLWLCVIWVYSEVIVTQIKIAMRDII